MQPFLPLRKDGKPASLGGIFSETTTPYIALTLEASTTTCRSCFTSTHLLVRNAVRDVPVWLN